mgnify:CR=1 FL=1
MLMNFQNGCVSGCEVLFDAGAGSSFLTRPWMRRVGSRLPPALRDTLKSPVVLRLLLRRVRWGNLRRLEPFDPEYGFGRGTPIDRVYIDEFLSEQAMVVRGEVLEAQLGYWRQQLAGAPAVLELPTEGQGG